MSGSAATWSSAHEVSVVVLAPQNLRRTVSIALIVGSTFFVMNQLGVILSGHATALVWLKAALTYVTPFLVSNYGLVSATRRRHRPIQPTHPRTTEEQRHERDNDDGLRRPCGR
jgi:hypothetical protein